MDAPSTALAGVRSFVTEHGLEAGDRLPPERALAESLGVSRPSLRQTLRQLAELGVLEPRVGAGTFLVGVDADDLMDVRVRLEPRAAALATTRGDAALVPRLWKLVARLERAVDEPNEFAALDAALHRALADACGNPVLQVCLRDIETMALFGRIRTVHVEATRVRAVEELRQLVTCIEAGRPAKAAAAMTAHLRSIAAAGGDAAGGDAAPA